MKRYFYSDGENKHGPFTIEELKNEDITKDSLVWYEGLDDWKPASEIDELIGILEIKPPPINVDTVAEIDNSYKDNSKEDISSDYHPWRRFFARTLDLGTSGFLIFYAMSFVIGYLFPNRVTGYIEIISNQLLVSIVIYIFWIPIEALLLSSTGTTPAKWLFRITISGESGGKLTFGEALIRSFNVFVKGEGFGIPILLLFTRIFAYRRLMQTGTTLWDRAVNAKVTHRVWSGLRTFVVFLLVFIYLIVFSILSYS